MQKNDCIGIAMQKGGVQMDIRPWDTQLGLELSLSHFVVCINESVGEVNREGKPLTAYIV